MTHQGRWGNKRFSQCMPGQVGYWQRTSVHLAVGCQRQRLEFHKGGGYHVGGQFFLHMVPQITDCGGLPLMENHVSNEVFIVGGSRTRSLQLRVMPSYSIRDGASASGIRLQGDERRALARHHHGFTYSGMLAEYCLNFSRLDAETSNLYLVIQAPQILDVAIWQVANPVPSFIKPCFRFATKWIAHKLRRCNWCRLANRVSYTSVEMDWPGATSTVQS